MTLATRISAGFVALLAISGSWALLASAAAFGAPSAAPTSAADPKLVVTITRLSPTTLQTTGKLLVHGTVHNPGPQAWLNAKAYLQISPEPATTLDGLDSFARVPDDTGLGSPILAYGDFDTVGNMAAGKTRSFTVKVPYADLPISGDPGVYRIGIKVVAGTPDGVRNPADAARANTLIPLLPAKTATLEPAPTVTLLPLTAPVKRLSGDEFADDSLAASISANGRLYDVLDWALDASPDTIQVVLDPALLEAVTDMSEGYRIPATQAAGTVAGAGQAAAAAWLASFNILATQQHVLLMPWGVPAANSLLDNGLPGPVVAAVGASTDYLADNAFGTAVAGWLDDGQTGLPALAALSGAGASLQIVAQSSLPGLVHTPDASLPSLVDIPLGHQQVPAIVAATNLAGFPTTTTTSALQFRQRLIADATVRSLSADTDQIRVTALPFGWDPGATSSGQEVATAFALPVIVAQSAIGTADRSADVYSGAVRPASGPTPKLSPDVVSAIRSLHDTGGNLASILSPTSTAVQDYQHAFAMAGSTEWVTYPHTGAALINQVAHTAQVNLAKVTLTGPPFVAMSSDSGRFPLTVTNGLPSAITVNLAVVPDNSALKIAKIATIVLPAGQRRDIQVVSTADGSGVTSVQARLATPTHVAFGKTWKFDVRATQIGLVIWVVMAVGGAVLFIAAGYRIVNRLRGKETPRRQPTG